MVNELRKSLLSVGNSFVSKAARSKTAKEAIEAREQGLTDLENRFRKGAQAVKTLKDIAKRLRSLPEAELDTPTVAFVGAPNVGKSRLVRVLSSGQPDVCNYPFTTRGISMGHFFIGIDRFIVT